MQLSYNVDPAIGLPGQVIKTGHEKIVEGLIANGAVRPGQYVVLEAGRKCAHPSAAPTANTRGGLVIRRAYGQNDGAYADGDIVDVLVQGNMIVATEDAVVDLGSVFVRHVAAGAEELGALRSDADGTDATAVPGLYYRSAGTLVECEIQRSAA